MFAIERKHRSTDLTINSEPIQELINVGVPHLLECELLRKIEYSFHVACLEQISNIIDKNFKFNPRNKALNQESAVANEKKIVSAKCTLTEMLKSKQINRNFPYLLVERANPYRSLFFLYTKYTNDKKDEINMSIFCSLGIDINLIDMSYFEKLRDVIFTRYNILLTYKFFYISEYHEPFFDSKTQFQKFTSFAQLQRIYPFCKKITEEQFIRINEGVIIDIFIAQAMTSGIKEYDPYYFELLLKKSPLAKNYK